MRGKRNHKLRTYDFLKSKPVLECQNWCLNLEGTLLLYNRGKCEKSAFKTMKKPSQCHEKHWTSKLWHMGQDLLHSSSVASTRPNSWDFPDADGDRDMYPLQMVYKKLCLLKLLLFCNQNCSDLLWEKIVLVTEKNFWNSRLNAECLQKFLDHTNNLFK